MRTHYIYKYTNRSNGKCYIGQTVDIKVRCRQEKYTTCTKFYRAIQKYGWDNFDFEILCECSENEVDERERYYIAFFDSVNNGYNLESGGCANKTVSDETKQKISQSGKGHIGYNKGKPAWNKGLKTPNDVRLKLSEAHKGQKVCHSEETKRKISEAQIGKIVSDETRKKQSESHKGKPSNNKGKTFSDEWRSNLSKAHLGKKPLHCMRKIKNLDTNKIFNSITEAAQTYQISSAHISSAANGKRQTAGGYRWQYID